MHFENLVAALLYMDEEISENRTCFFFFNLHIVYLHTERQFSADQCICIFTVLSNGAEPLFFMRRLKLLHLSM